MATIDIILPTRDEIATDFKDAWRARSEQADPARPADVNKGTFPYLVAEAVADVVLPLYSNHDKIARADVVRGKTGERLEAYAAERLPLNEDGTVRLPATGGSGYFEVTKIAVGGSYIPQGTVVTNQATGFRYQVVASATYLDGDPIPIVGIDTGPETNLAADAPILFESPPVGCTNGGLVLAQDDGTGNLVGLTGGRGAETDEELQDRVIDAQTNPAAAGNEAEIVQKVQSTPAVPVQKGFVIPAWFGPGSACVGFTLRPGSSATRIPNSTQRGLVDARVRASFPTDYSITTATLLEQSFTVALGVSWITTARGWSDITPWPEYVAAEPVYVDGVTSITSNGFRVTTSVDTTTPQVGQTIALFNLVSQRFMRKRIATVSVNVANRSWDLTFDTSLNVSDVFIPEDGALVSPFSSSMQRIIAPLIAYNAKLGPGEQFATLPDPGGRQRRWPFSPDVWPSIITNEGLVTASKASGVVADTEVLLPSTPYTTTVGTPGVSMYLLSLGDLAIFPQT